VLSELFKPNLCVIGAGSGGLSVTSIRASAMLMERARMRGGRLNDGITAKSPIAGNNAVLHPHTKRIPAMRLEAGCTDQKPAASVRLRGGP
jgi:hypothetical protein